MNGSAARIRIPLILTCAISLHAEALAECMTYCEGLLSVSLGNSMHNLLSVHDFLENRGDEY